MARSTASKTVSGKRIGNGAIRTYRAALRFLASVTDYERQVRVGYNHTTFNLARMSRLLKHLGNPHRLFRSVHIAGTKGKGSTATMLSSMLQACGYSVGLYTSPHLVDLRERIVVDGKMITERELTRLVAQIALVVRRLKKDDPTFFELMTAAAFMYFAEREVDVAVVETGLGGRLDSTNVLKPEVCGVTSISLDHQQQLGSTLGAIAEEKAGIFKANVPVVSAPQTPEVTEVLERAASRAGAPLRIAGREIEFSYRFESSRAVGPHTRVCVTTPESKFEHLHVPLLGEHQAINCGVALGLLDALKQRGLRIDDQEAMGGLADVRLAGRMELIAEEPRVLVDGAHNGASVEALMRAIGQNIPYDSMVVIFGCGRDKDIDGMLGQIRYGADKIIFTQSRSPKAVEAQDLADRFVKTTGKMAQVAETLSEAVDIAKRAVTREDLICITGSFYLVGEAKKLLGE